ncbi:MAG: ABC transporter permease [Burkholderiaceae bacterium]
MFILNVVLSRQVATQRGQIAALKALGYTDGAIAWHYIQFAFLIAGMGVFAGLGMSVAIGYGMLSLYDGGFSLQQPRLCDRTLAGGRLVVHRGGRRRAGHLERHPIGSFLGCACPGHAAAACPTRYRATLVESASDLGAG